MVLALKGHLHKVLQASTGHSTSARIARRLADEAQALLRHSNWRIADIAHGLGFGYASNFQTFFKWLDSGAYLPRRAWCSPFSSPPV